MKTFRSLIFLGLLTLIACAKSNSDDPMRDPANATQGSCEVNFVQNDLCGEFSWDRKPTETDFGQFVVEFHTPDDASNFVDLQSPPEIDLWMPSMGHGSSPVTIEELHPGQYRVSNVFFSMHGDWVIRFKIKNGAGVVEQAELPVRY